jgi:predicted transcriptional regulator
MENDLLSLTARIVSALAGANDVEADQLPILIQSVYQTLAMVGQTVSIGLLRVAQPAVSTKASLFSNRIVCLDCGQSFRILRRHIAAVHGLTPEQYRVKWELPHDYPMASADYAARQSRFAKARFGKSGS